MCSNFIYQTDLQIALPTEEALSIWVLRMPSLDKIIPLISYAILFLSQEIQYPNVCNQIRILYKTGYVSDKTPL